MIPADEPDVVVAQQAAERADDCARIVSERPVVRCPDCRLVQFQTRNGLCRRCDKPLLKAALPLAKIPKDVIPARKPCVPERSLELGAAIRAVRKAAGLTQSKLGFDQVSVYQWESGRRIPSWDIAEKIAAVFGLTVMDLIQGPEHAEIVYRFGKLLWVQQVEICDKVKGVLHAQVQ